MQIFVTTMTGKRITLDIEPSDTIASMKTQIREQAGIGLAKQRLIFAGNLLMDEQILSDCKIQKDSNIMLREMTSAISPAENATAAASEPKPAAAAAASGGGGGGSSTGMTRAEKAAFISQDLSVILAAYGLGNFVDSFKAFGVEAVGDLMDPGCMTDGDLEEDMAMTPKDVATFKALRDAFASVPAEEESKLARKKREVAEAKAAAGKAAQVSAGFVTELDPSGAPYNESFVPSANVYSPAAPKAPKAKRATVRGPSSFLSCRVSAAPSTAFPGLESPRKETHARPGEGWTDILVSVQPPAAGVRPPTDMVCVVDVSGSMGAECTNGDAESQGLSVLDIVKHACKTIVHTLTAVDRFCLVTYSNSSRVALALTFMNPAGVAAAEAAVDAMKAAGQTNLWDGLRSGLEVLGRELVIDRNEEAVARNKAVLLLTDGLPNIVGTDLQYARTKSEVGLLRDWQAKHSPLAMSINTFGFGYTLNSRLLADLACEGGGGYYFIPDASFVGTAFVNATSNILSTAAVRVEVHLNGAPMSPSMVANTQGRLLGVAGNAAVINAACYDHGVGRQRQGFMMQEYSSYWSQPAGSVQFGQGRDVVFSIPTSALSEALAKHGTISGDAKRPKCEVVLEYSLPGSPGRHKAAFDVDLEAAVGLGGEDISDPADRVLRGQAAFHALRLRTLDAIYLHTADSQAGRGLVAVGLGGGSSTWDLAKASGAVGAVGRHLAEVFEGAYGGGGEALEYLAGHGMLGDFARDVQGQVSEALGREDWWTKWGVHYLPSLLAAHGLQQCNNFKDHGVQHYGGPLFLSLRDTAEQTFVKLPPPIPSIVATAASPSPRSLFSSFFGGSKPTTPSAAKGASAAPAAKGKSAATPKGKKGAAAPAVDMTRFYQPDGGCFTAQATATVFLDASFGECEQVAVGRLRAGASVLAFRLQDSGRVLLGAATVGAVVETLLDASQATGAGPLLVTLPSGVALTPWHPVVDFGPEPQGVGEGASKGAAWAFPAELAGEAGCAVDEDEETEASSSPSSSHGGPGVFVAAHRPDVSSVFNLALLPPADAADGAWHGVVLNGSTCVITLGHGIVGHPVASHAYYGSGLVLEDIARLAAAPGGVNSSGRVTVSAARHARAAAAAVAAAAARPSTESAAMRGRPLTEASQARAAVAAAV